MLNRWLPQALFGVFSKPSSIVHLQRIAVRSMRPNRTLHRDGRTKPDSILGLGLFMSTTQSKWSKDAGKPHQVASPPRGRLRVCWLTSACQRTLCKAHNTTTQQGTRYANQLARHTMQCIHLPNHFPISSFNAISCTTHAALPHCICQIITLQ